MFRKTKMKLIVVDAEGQTVEGHSGEEVLSCVFGAPNSIWGNMFFREPEKSWWQRLFQPKKKSRVVIFSTIGVSQSDLEKTFSAFADEVTLYKAAYTSETLHDMVDHMEKYPDALCVYFGDTEDVKYMSQMVWGIMALSNGHDTGVVKPDESDLLVYGVIAECGARQKSVVNVCVPKDAKFEIGCEVALGDNQSSDSLSVVVS